MEELAVLQDDSYDPSLHRPGASDHFPHFAPVSRDSPDKGYFMFVDEADTLKIKTVNSKGELSNSRVAHIGPSIHLEDRPFVTSSSHETFGFCGIVTANRSVHCRQYDFGLSPRANLTWTIGQFARRASMYNLAEGGFLLLTGDSRHGRHHYLLTKVEPDGRRTEPVELRDHCEPALLYEKKDGGYYCSYGLCWDQAASNVTVDVRCVHKRHFVAN